MKKTYSNPTMEVVKLQMHQQMLAGSLPITGEDATTNGSGDYNDARDFDFDDEDEY